MQLLQQLLALDEPVRLEIAHALLASVLDEADERWLAEHGFATPLPHRQDIVITLL